MWKRKKRKSQQMKYDQTKHARMNLEKKKSLLTIMKNFKNRIVHGIMLSIVSLGKWTIMHTKNNIILISLCLLFSNVMLWIVKKKKNLFSYFTIKIDIYTEDNNLILDRKIHFVTWIILFLFMYLFMFK